MRTKKHFDAKVSVIIPTYNAGPGFGDLLDRLWSQSNRPHEIIVIDSSSEDGTPDVAVRNGAMLLTIAREEFDHGGARNKAAAAATGDVLLFMTQDALPVDSFVIEYLVQALQDGKVACAYARQIPKDDANILEKLSRTFNYPEESALKSRADLPRHGIKTFFCSNVCAAYRRDVFEAMGRFDEPVYFNEDLLMAAKCVLAGYFVAYAAEAKVYHSHHYRIGQLFRRYFDNGASLRDHSWILQHAAVRQEGARLVLVQLKELCRGGHWGWIPRLFAESVAKFAGYQLGMRYDRLPRALVARWSMYGRASVVRSLESAAAKNLKL